MTRRRIMRLFGRAAFSGALTYVSCLLLIKYATSIPIPISGLIAFTFGLVISAILIPRIDE